MRILWTNFKLTFNKTCIVYSPCSMCRWHWSDIH